MDDYGLLERNFFEKRLINELNDSKSISKQYYREIQNYRRPDSYNRNNISKRFNVFREISGDRKTEKIIITKPNKKRVFRSI
jgi:hypothetical protein